MSVSPTFEPRHRDILAGRLASVVAPTVRGGETLAALVREGNETVVLRAALLAMQDVGAELLTNIAKAALESGQVSALSVILEKMNGTTPVKAPAETTELAPNVWHNTTPMVEAGPLPAGLRPDDMVVVVFRDGVRNANAFPAKQMMWTECGDSTIAKFWIMAEPSPEPGADDWRKIPINAGTLHDLLLSRAKLHPGAGPLDADGLESMALSLRAVSEVRARGPR